MNAPSARATQAWRDAVGGWGCDTKLAFEEGWEAGHEAARADLAAQIRSDLDSLAKLDRVEAASYEAGWNDAIGEHRKAVES